MMYQERISKVLEKMNEVGRKLLITGKGRCNITSNIPMEEFIRNIPGNGKFLYGAFNNFTNEDIITIVLFFIISATVDLEHLYSSANLL